MNPDVNPQQGPAPEPQPMPQSQPDQPQQPQPMQFQPQQGMAMGSSPAPVSGASGGGGSLLQSVGDFFNMSGTATKKDFLHGFITWIVAAVGSVIVAVILFVIAGAITGIEIERAETTAERPAYVYRSDFTGDISRPYSSSFDNYSEYTKALTAYNEAIKAAEAKYEAALSERKAALEKYEADRDKADEAYDAKTGVRDGFASIFTSLGMFIMVLVTMLGSAAMWGLLVRRLKDAGLSVKWIIFALGAPILVGELAFIISQFIAPNAAANAIANLLLMNVTGFFKALQPLIFVNLVAVVLAGGITIATLIICFAKNTSELKGRSFLEVLKN